MVLIAEHFINLSSKQHISSDSVPSGLVPTNCFKHHRYSLGIGHGYANLLHFVDSIVLFSLL